MELPTLLLYCAITVSAVVLLMQIISLVKIAGLKKIIAALSETRTPVHVPHERHERKPGELRRPEKRNFPEPRVRQERAPVVERESIAPAVEPVEQSLREINMKLKNAERDQEVARKKLQEPGSREPRGDHHRGGSGRGDRDRRGHRGDRDRDGGQRGNRRDTRDSWQERNRTSEPRQEGNEAEETRLPREPIAASIPPRETFAPIQETPASAPVSPVEDFTSDESLQHGRKFVVKRRQLKEDGSPADEGAAPERATEVGISAVPAASAPQAPEAQPEAGNEPEQEIHFGRKRHGGARR